MLNAKLIRNIIGWGLALLIPVSLLAAFCIGVVASAGPWQCEGLQTLELKELLSAEERMAMQVYYQCDDKPDLTKIPMLQVGEVLEILNKLYNE